MQQKPASRSEAFVVATIKDVVVRDLPRFRDDRGWLSQLFRQDDLEPEFFPVMTYVSSTKPGVTRGPHEHQDQADFFFFIGPSNFKLRMWDNRSDSPTYRNMMALIVGEDEPKTVLIPKGIVHAYENVGAVNGILINCPNRLYQGQHRQDPIDQIRHEDDPDTIFRMD